MHEKTARLLLLIISVILWATSLTLSLLVITRTVDQVAHPGIGLIVFMSQGLAITCTVVWAQFRVRRIMVEVMKAGFTAGKSANHSGS